MDIIFGIVVGLCIALVIGYISFSIGAAIGIIDGREEGYHEGFIDGGFSKTREYKGIDFPKSEGGNFYSTNKAMQDISNKKKDGD